MAIQDLVKDAQTIAVICTQWGDTGKGKFSDYLTEHWADVIARGTGGNNAGHTVVVNGEKRAFHLLPSSITHEEKTHILGNGMVIDLDVLCDEIDKIDESGIKYDNLMISRDAHVILPYHIDRDQRKNVSMKKGGIGSTGRGIGPAYEDKVSRKGIMIRDLFDNDVLKSKITERLKHYALLNDENDNRNLNDKKLRELSEKIIDDLKPLAERIKPFVRDTISEMRGYMERGKKILLEGAQGLLLSVEFGSYPYVTSSDCSINGTAAGVGLSAGAIDIPFGVVKFPFMTRVGAGPFPTELGGDFSEGYCAEGLEHNIEYELSEYGIPFKKEGNNYRYDLHHPNIIKLMNSHIPFEQGVGIRLAGYEYGTTTGRPRRTGWTDLAALRYAVSMNGQKFNGKFAMPLILTKADVLQGASVFNLGAGYENRDGFTRDSWQLRTAIPAYKTFPGFDGDISQIRDYENLPRGLKRAMTYMEDVTGGIPTIVSTGPDRNDTIVRDIKL